jgi:hypothetical protein
MKGSGPLRRGLRTALQLTVTLLGAGALVTVLNGLLHLLGGGQRLLDRPAALVTTALHSLDARGRRWSPGEYRGSSRRSYRWPAGSGHRGLNDVNPGRD